MELGVELEAGVSEFEFVDTVDDEFELPSPVLDELEVPSDVVDELETLGVDEA